MKQTNLDCFFFYSILLVREDPNTPKYQNTGGKIMENRNRKNQLKIYLNDEELALFREKMKMTNSKTMAHFIRKTVLEKEIYVVDLEPFRDLQWLISNATNNINQVAKHVNQTGVVYKSDIETIKKEVDRMSKEVWQIHSLLLNRTKDGDD